MAQEVVARGSRGPRRARPRRHGDAGFTLVEVVIAFAVMAIAMAAMVPLVWGSLASAAVANHRTTANGLAVQATENLRAVAYDELGFTSSAGVPSSCGGANPVTNVAASGIPPTDESAQTVGPLTYTTTSCVYWVDSSASPTYSQAYKQTVVAVTWTDSGGSHSVQQVSDVYPGGQGPYTVADNNYGSATTTTAPPSGTPSAPTLTSAVDEMAPNDTSAIDLAWSAPSSTPVAISYYVVDYSTTGTFVSGTYAQSPEVAGNGTTFAWTASGLAAGTLYYFQVVALAANGVESAPSNLKNAATDSSSTTTCQITGLSVSPTTGVVDSSGSLVNGNPSGFSLAANLNSYCTGTVTVQYETSAGPQSATLSYPPGGGQGTGTAGTSSTTWNDGTDSFTVYLDGVQYAPIDQALVNICTEHGNSGKC